jgi:tRNA(Ile)-lysidine synthase
VEPGNLQAQARGARYAALAAEAARAGARRIATGHTRTDQAETVLLRLLRGAGARGLSAIPRRRGALIRPLLSCGREAVLAYLARRGLAWNQDPSNLTGRYARNRLRLEVWPLLQRDNPRLEEALARTADLLREDERALGAQALALLSPVGDGVPVAALRQAPRAVQRRAIRRLATRAARGGRPGEPRLEARHVEAALALLRPGAPRRAGLRGGLEAAVEGGRLVVRRLEAAAGATPGADQVVAIPGPGRYALAPGGAGVSVSVEGGSLPGVTWPLFLRTRRAGDRIRPAGGRGGKSLKAWLIDRKVVRSRRDGLLLVVDAGGQVLAIPELGVRSRDLPAAVAVRVATAG